MNPSSRLHCMAPSMFSCNCNGSEYHPVHAMWDAAQPPREQRLVPKVRQQAANLMKQHDEIAEIKAHYDAHKKLDRECLNCTCLLRSPASVTDVPECCNGYLGGDPNSRRP